MAISSNTYPQAYIDYLVYFHSARDYFECHEVMEEHWKSDLHDPLRDVYVGLIQLAVCLYHHRRGNWKGATKMLDSAVEKLTHVHVERLALDPIILKEMLVNYQQRMHASTLLFDDLSLPIVDIELLNTCKHISATKGYVWGQSSNNLDNYIYHKHRLRDRSGVIAEREAQKIRKAQKIQNTQDDTISN